MTPAPDEPRARRPALRVSPRGLALVAAVWAVLVLGAIGLASALDSPVGAGARDEAQPVAPMGAVADAPPAAGAEGEAESEGEEGGLAPANLPPLALVTVRPLPPEIADLEPDEQLRRMRARAEGGTDPAAWVDLGVLLQGRGATDDAADAFGSALRIAPDDVEALTGVAMSGGGSTAALATAAEELGRLAAAHPDSATVAMNLGWVELYRGHPEAMRAALERAVTLGGDSRIGRIARALVQALDEGALGAQP